MFIDDKDFIDVAIFYKKKGRNYYAYTTSELDDILEEQEKILKKMEEERKDTDELELISKDDYSIFNLKMKCLDWELYNDLQESALVESPITQEKKFNYKLYKEAKLKNLIISWDARDDKGKIIEVKQNTILKLSPQIAEAIIRGYDEGTLLDGDEEKKS